VDIRGNIMSNSKKWHNLYEVFWTEEICYLGKNKWLLRYSGQDLPGTEEKDTNDLLNWILESDGYDQEDLGLQPFFDTEKTQLIGPRTIIFRKLATKYKLADCVFAINKKEMRRITNLLDLEYAVVVTDYEKLKQRERLKVLKNEESIRAHNEKINLVNRLVRQYSPPVLVKRVRGGGGMFSGQDEMASYRNKLFDYIENYYYKNKETPSGIHMIAGIDKHMSKPIGFIDFDELELKARSMWEDYLDNNKHNISWEEVDSGRRRNGMFIDSFYCSWVLDDGYVDVYVKAPIKSDSHWYLKVIYPIREDGSVFRKTIQSNNFISLCSYVTHDEFDLNIKDFVIGCDKELSVDYDEVKEAIKSYWGT
jgi:hypothetical protein